MMITRLMKFRKYNVKCLNELRNAFIIRTASKDFSLLLQSSSDIQENFLSEELLWFEEMQQLCLKDPQEPQNSRSRKSKDKYPKASKEKKYSKKSKKKRRK